MTGRIFIPASAVTATVLGLYLYFRTGNYFFPLASICAAILTAASSLIHHITSDNRPGPVSSGESSVFACSVVFAVFTTGLYALAIPVHMITAPLLTSVRPKERRNVFTGAVIVVSTAIVIYIFKRVSAIDENLFSIIISGTGNSLSLRGTVLFASAAICIFAAAIITGRFMKLRCASLEYHPRRIRASVMIFSVLFRTAAVIPLFILSGLSAAAPFHPNSRSRSDIIRVILFSLVHYELFYIAVDAGFGILFCVFTVAEGFLIHYIHSRTEVTHDRDIRSYFHP